MYVYPVINVFSADNVWAKCIAIVEEILDTEILSTEIPSHI